ncbi:MAG: shikimate dehydrogenase [Anaerolineae bacterium]|nr:shikimate dehydrogenase [Anaerolineae bacterium]
MNRVGVVGWPIEHSLSPVMHNAAFQALGMEDWYYDAMAVPPDIPRHAVVEPKRHGYIGLNVTVPFKQAVMRYVHPDEKARAIGAVNTIIYEDDKGTNTDADGLIDDLLAHDVQLKGERVIVLGAGGAARAAVYGLWQQGAYVVVVNRTMERAHDMLMQLTMTAGIRSVQALTLDEAVEKGASLIVNCTTAGMWPNVDTSPWVDGVAIPEGVTLYDMVYRPAQTKLMGQIEQAGGRSIGGLGMLVRQGAAAFKLWTGVEPPVDVMQKAAAEALAARESH